MSRNSGYVVMTKNDKKGRTYHSKGLIKGKVAVYLETTPFAYDDKAILCDPDSLKIIGYVD